MDIVKVDASIRTQAGKGPAKRLRREGRIPAVAYGRELAAIPLAIVPSALSEILKSELGQNTVVELGIDGQKKVTALLREYTVHPISRDILHADFVEIRLDRPVDVEVPFVCQGKAAGVVAGGILRQVYRRLPIRCLPENIPVSIEYDVSSLQLGDHVKASQLSLPQQVTIRLAPEQTIAGIVAPEKEKPEEVEGAAGAAAAAATGVPGAPAALGAPGAPGAPAAAAEPAAAAGGKEEKQGRREGREDRKKR